ncbi:double-strand break repair helicase AddA [Arenibaculum pallidiluteum]|uniref:double-strand break repair helicase AddA n=1 Tax=Arenibaculum pallidiluteum TaxID=2812559 RepID=UPI001A97A17E|nr:double-strand break repair helicase AddA [Arenibaculum pallidiluteum]
MTVADRTLPIDPNVKQRAASDPECSVWVGASAGTGKTKVLTDRVLRLMLAGTPPHRILCLTFTKAAAAEMANRINGTLARWATVSDAELEDALAALCGERPSSAARTAARRLFAQVVDCPGGMKIQTIHAFCQSLLRRFPLEARLPPHFEVMDDRTAEELLAGAKDAVLRRARAEPETLLGQSLARLTRDVSQEDFATLLRDLTAERGRLRRILEAMGGVEGAIAAVYAHLGVAPGSDDSAVLEEICRDGAFDRDGLDRACQALDGGSDTDRERGRVIRGWLAQAGDRAEGFLDFARAFLTTEGQVRKTLITRKAADAFGGAREALEAEAARLLLAMERVKAAGVAGSTAALMRLAEALLDAYEEAKRGRARLDYDDLILNALALLRDPGAPWVLFKLDGGLDHLLIDEAQDTNPEQWQVVAALAEEFFAGLGSRDGVRTLFAVGDEKQSIFSFQRADPAEFARMRGHFQARVEAAEARWAKVDLEISFRSTGAVLEAVDAVFTLQTARDGVAFETGTVIRHIPFRRGHAGLVELWPPVAPEEPPEPAPWEPPVERRRADAPSARLAAVIASTVRRWLDSGERLEARGRPILAGDVMVLVRRRSRFVEELVRACKERGVPVAGVDRMVLTEQLSVMDLMALGRFLLLPEDDLTLATVLKGPFLGLSEEQLFELAWNRRGTLFSALAAKADSDPLFLGPAFAWLRALLDRTDFAPPFEFFARVLSQPCPADPGPGGTGRRALLARLGPEAQDPVDEFLSACLAFERSHAPSLQGFLHWLEASEAEIKRELDADRGEDGGKLRIMTVHGSKGLQAPIVFLPDTMGVPIQGPRILWPDGALPVPLFSARRAQEDRTSAGARARADLRRDQEYRRLLYVALTRAEDRLYVCGWQGRRPPGPDCWYRLTEAAMQEHGEPCAFDFSELCPEGWAGPGWRLRGPQTVPARPDGLGLVEAAAAAPLPGWAAAAAPEEPSPARPLTPSRPDTPEPALRSPLGADDGARFLRGTLVHRLLQTLPELEAPAREQAARRYLSRPAHRLAAEQQDEIALETLAVLADPRFAPYFGPGSRAEVPVVGVVGQDRVIAGQVDRLLVTEDEVWILDYKTNRPAPMAEEDVSPAYLQQMAAYRAALRRIYPGRDVRCALIWTDGPRPMPLSSALLDRWAP